MRKRFLRNQSGTVTIEFVVMIPLFLAALAFSFEFGRLFIAHNVVVNHMRSAVRYVSRSDLSNADITAAENIIRTGKPNGVVADQPVFLTSANAVITWTNPYATFTTADFSRGGKTIRVTTRVNFPLLMFNLASASSPVTIPFVIVEDFRYAEV
jgi:Flp pilus assembly protein TadG